MANDEYDLVEAPALEILKKLGWEYIYYNKLLPIRVLSVHHSKMLFLKKHLKNPSKK
jgi:hypothetical protein